jgi:very-short-patch-repair endonuclease
MTLPGVSTGKPSAVAPMSVAAHPWLVPKKGGSPRSRAIREERLRLVLRLAAGQGAVVSRRQLRRLGITRDEVVAHVRAARWRPLHTQSLVTHTGPVERAGLHWAAVFEGGDRSFLDGVSSLLAGGLDHYTEDSIRVSVPRGVLARRAEGVVIRQTRRYDESDRVPLGIPRSRNHIAAVRAAVWARSDKQATLLLTLAVQQGLTTPTLLAEQLMRVRRDPRRRLMTAVVTDMVQGVRSLGEHEFAQMCRQRGVPAPSRQVLRRGKDGHYYLDVMWEPWGVVVEIDGIQHSWATNVVADALRHNAVTIDNAVVLRLPLLGLRVAADEFFAQVVEALLTRGCPLDLAS